MKISKAYFQEIQQQSKFGWFILFFVDSIFVIGVIKQLVFNEQYGDKPMSNAGLLIITILLILITLLLTLYCKLQTYIGKEGIYVRYLPFQLKYKYFDWNSIEKIYIRRYNPFTEFGGWGLKKTLKGTAYTVKGRMGLQLELSNKKKVLIGTQETEYIRTILLKLGKIS